MPIQSNSASAIINLDVDGVTAGWTFTVVNAFDSALFDLVDNSIHLKSGVYYAAREYKLLVTATAAGQPIWNKIVVFDITDTGVDFVNTSNGVNFPASVASWDGGYCLSVGDISFNFYNPPGSHDYELVLLSKVHGSAPYTDGNYFGGPSEDLGDVRLAVSRRLGVNYLVFVAGHHNSFGNAPGILTLPALTPGWHSIKMHYQPWSAWLERFIYCDDVLVHDGFYAGNMFNIPNPVGYLYSCGNMADGMRPLFSNLSVVINSTQYIKEELKLAPAAGVIGTPTFNVGS